ncbi:DoxX family protein [Catellatospora vulcania]|uniref:DoxX family protein n=1 Tax=Catellatospora vulcania TaxID=1460450 RepID=UPI0012D44154|nr:DoxX family protein [Catellatospora vulcania]
MDDIADNHDRTNGTSMPGMAPVATVPDTAARRAADSRHSIPVGRHTLPVVAPALPEPSAAARYLLAAIRIALGWIFLWAFLDKLFGWGFGTPSAKSVLSGGSPTLGFLSSAKGPFSGFFQSIAGNPVTDLLFMAALLAIGGALILGIGMRAAAVAGAVLTVLMWAAVLPPANNPLLDEHLVYAAILIVLAVLGAGDTFGLGRSWAATALVRRAAWLR